jgi:hypothetical protein
MSTRDKYSIKRGGSLWQTWTVRLQSCDLWSHSSVDMYQCVCRTYLPNYSLHAYICGRFTWSISLDSEIHMCSQYSFIHKSKWTKTGASTERSVSSYINSIPVCKIWGFQGGDYEEWHLLGCYAMWLLQEPTLRRNLVPPSRIGELGTTLAVTLTDACCKLVASYS